MNVVAKKVRTIPARVEPITMVPINSLTKKRVCAYARVSTDQDSQLSSYEAQVDYYTKLIQKNPEWEYVDCFADEGISGTSTKHRAGFNKMIDEALAGNIDLIITKSVSRFARNTVDTLQTVRKLKDKGVDVYFEKENVHSNDSKGELMLSIIASISQEESRSISLNTTWGIRKTFSDGKVRMSCSNFLGYDMDENGKLIINKEQAEVVKLIYKLYLLGYSCQAIKKELEKRNILSPAKKKRWHVSTVYSILQNEKFKGDVLLQKSYTVDFLTKKKKINEGEIQQYYVDNDHEEIIDKKTFDYVQTEIKKRKKVNAPHYSGTNIFTSKLFCGECGGAFGRKIWHSNDKYRQIVYQCNEKFKEKRCKTRHITEEDIKKKFICAYNGLIKNRSEILNNAKIIRDFVNDSSKEDAKADELNKTMERLKNENDALIDKNATIGMSQEVYNNLHNKIVEDYNKAKAEYDKTIEIINDKHNRAIQIDSFIKTFRKSNKLKDFDENLWAMLVEKMLIYKDKVEIEWKDGKRSEC